MNRLISVAALCLAVACCSPHAAPVGERYRLVAILAPPRPADPCFEPLTSMYELRADSQWMAVDSVAVTCHANDALRGGYAFGTHYGTAWGSYSRNGNRLSLAGDSIRQDDRVAEENHHSRQAELRGDSLIFLAGAEAGPAMVYVRVRTQ